MPVRKDDSSGLRRDEKHVLREAAQRPILQQLEAAGGGGYVSSGSITFSSVLEVVGLEIEGILEEDAIIRKSLTQERDIHPEVSRRSETATTAASSVPGRYSECASLLHKRSCSPRNLQF